MRDIPANIAALMTRTGEEECCCKVWEKCQTYYDLLKDGESSHFEELKEFFDGLADTYFEKLTSYYNTSPPLEIKTSPTSAAAYDALCARNLKAEKEKIRSLNVRFYARVASSAEQYFDTVKVLYESRGGIASVTQSPEETTAVEDIRGERRRRCKKMFLEHLNIMKEVCVFVPPRFAF